MRERSPGERVRVVIAGNVYEKRSLVKRFLEDDGFYVVADVRGRDALFAALEEGEPDAIVIEAGLLGEGAAEHLARVREAAPDSRIVVFTAARPDPASVPPGADGYIQKGAPLAALTSMLHGLVAETTIPTAPAAPREPAAAETTGEGREVVRGTPFRVAVAALVSLAVLAALIVYRGPARDAGEPRARPSPEIPGRQVSVLDLAMQDLNDLEEALEQVRYVYARVLAQSLVDNRDRALAEGFSVSALDAAIQTTLEPFMASLSPNLLETLAGILGNLLPPVPEEEAEEGAGTTGGVTSDGGDVGDGGSGDTTIEPPFPGKGKHLGWANKPPKGGWRHGHHKR